MSIFIDIDFDSMVIRRPAGQRSVPWVVLHFIVHELWHARIRIGGA